MPFNVYRGGGYEGNDTPITLGKAGTYKVQWSYQNFEIPDQVTFRYNGKVLLDTGFVGGTDSGTFKIKVPSGGGKFAAVVGTNNPSTQWNFGLQFDAGPDKPEANADKGRTEKQDDGTRRAIINLAANDTSTIGLDPASITITNQPKTGTVRANADGTITYTSMKPGRDAFYYTIKDKDGNVSEAAKVTVLGDCPDPDPIAVSGVLHHNENENFCEGTGVFSIGRTDGDEDLLDITGRVMVFEDRVEIRDAIIKPKAVFGLATGLPLFHGNLTLPARTLLPNANPLNAAVAESSLLQITATGPNDVFKLAGVLFTPTKLQLATQSLNVMGTFVLPDALGATAIELTFLNSLTFDSEGVHLGGGKISLPNHEFKLFGLKVASEGVTLEYQAVQDLLKMQGKFTLGTSLAKEDQQSYGKGAGIVLDFLGTVLDANYIQVKNGIADMKGSFAVTKLVAAGGYGLDELKITLQTDNGFLNRFGLDGKLTLPFPKLPGQDPLKLGGGFEVLRNPDGSGEWGITRFNLSAETIDKPLPFAPVFFLQNVSGAVTGFAAFDPADIAFNGGLKFTLGPSSAKVHVELPEWLVGGAANTAGYDVAPLTIDLSGMLAVEKLTGAFKMVATGSITVFHEDILKVSLSELSGNFQTSTFKLVGGVSAFLGSINGSVGGTLVLNEQPSLTLTGSVAGNLPKSVLLGKFSGAPLTGANYAQVTTFNNNDSDDFEAYWAKASIYIPGIGKTVEFTYGVKETHPNGFFAAPSIGLILSSKDVPIVGSWDTVPGQSYLMMTKEWTNDIPDHVPLRVMYRELLPGGGLGPAVVFEEADFDAAGIAIVSEFTNSFAATVVVGDPLVGRWDILLPDEGFDFGTVTQSGFAEQADVDPEFNHFGTDGTHYSFDYRADAVPDGATISFYWDDDGEGFDGTLITTRLSLAGDYQLFTWTPSDLEDRQGDGHFSIYAIVDQPAGFPIMEYLPVEFDFPGMVDVAVTRSDFPERVLDGNYFQYLLTITNSSDRELFAATLSEELDGARITDVAVLGNGSWERTDDGSVMIRADGLSPYDSLTIVIYARADKTFFHGTRTDSATGDQEYEVPGVSAEAHVKAVGMEGNFLNNASYASAEYAAQALDDTTGDLKVERLFTTDISGSIGTVRYDLVVTNQGRGTVHGGVLTELVLGGEVESFYGRPLSGSFGDIRYAGQQLTVALPDLYSGQKYILPVSFHAIEAAPLTLFAQVEHPDADLDHRNDFAIDHLDATALGDEPGAVDLALRIASITDGADGLALVRLELLSEGRFENLASDMQVRLTVGSGLTLLSTDARDPATQPADTSFPTYDAATGVWSLNGAIQGDGQVRVLTVTLRKDSLAGGVFKAELIGLRERDEDSAPGNGVPTEDDIVVATIGGVNNAPVLNSLVPDLTVSEGDAISYRLPANTFSDPDGDILRYTARGLPDWLKFDAATQLFTGVAQPEYQNQIQAYTISVSAFDDRGGLTTDTFRLAVNDVRNAPAPNKAYPDAIAFVGVSFNYSLPANVPFDARLAYFTDGDLYRTIPGTYDYNHYGYQFFQQTAGSPSWLGYYGGAVGGVPDAPGSYDITVVARNHYYDGLDLDGSQNFHLTVVAIEPPVPGALIGDLAGLENAPFTYTVPADAFTDPNGDALGYWWTGLPTWLTYDIETGALSGTPWQGDTGNFDAILHASDGKLGVAQQVVHFTIGNVNDAPQAGDDAYALLAGQSIAGDVTVNDTDRDGDALTWTLVDGPTQGSLVFNPDGHFSFAAGSNASGADFFTYRAGDGALASKLARVDLFFQGAPTGQADSYAARMNVNPDPWSGGWGDRVLAVDEAHGLLANDPVFPNAIFRQVELVAGPQHGVLKTFGLDGSFSYRATNEFYGIDSFTYRGWDGLTRGAPVTVTITIPFENRAAAGQYDTVNGFMNADGLPAATTDAPLTFNKSILIRNDNARDGDPLTAVLVSTTRNGTLVENGDGTLTYTPDAGFRGNDTFQYNPHDPYGPGVYTVTAAINVTAPDAFIDARDDLYATPLDTPLTVGGAGVIRNDADPDTSLIWAGDGSGLYYDRVLLVTGPTHGTLEYFNDNGTFRYTPDSGFSGSDSFVYRSAEYNRPAGDGELNPDRASVTILVGGSIDAAAPTAVGERYDTQEDVVFKTDVAHGVLANDVSPSGGTLVAELVTQAQYGRVILSPYGNFRYEPATNYYDGSPQNLNGPDAFTYRVWDGAKVSAPVAVVLNVLPVADVPRAPDLYDYTSQIYGNQPQGNVTAYGAGTPDRDGAASAVNGAAGNVGVFVQGQYGRFFLNAGGAYLYQPDFSLAVVHAAKPGETLEDLFTYTWTNSAGSSTGTYHARIQGVDDATVGVADVYDTTPNTALNIHAELGVLVNDLDADGNVGGATLISGAANGALGFNASGAFTYTPRLGFVGTDVFSYRPTTANGNDAATQVSIRVQPLVQNTAPVAQADSYGMTGAGPLVVGAASGVLANDSDAQSDPFIALLRGTPEHGTLALNQDGSFTYRAAAGFSGEDSFTYRASDGQLASADTVVRITVPANQAPVTSADGRSTDEDTTLTASLVGQVTDAEGDALSFAVVTAPQHGLLRLNAAGGYTYTPAADYSGADVFAYSADDGRNTVTGQVAITVRPVNDAPVAGTVGYVMEEDGLLDVQPPGMIAFAHDADGDALTLMVITAPLVGQFDAQANGGFTYRPPADFFGSVNFAFAVTDGALTSNTVNASITVLPQNDPPATQEDAATTSFNTAVTIAVLANDSDAEGDALSTVIRTQPSHGSIVVQPDNTVVYIPTIGFRGQDSFTYSAYDGVTLSVTAPVVVTVQGPPNVAPIARADSAVTNEEVGLTVDILGNDTPGDDDPLTITILEAPHVQVAVRSDGKLDVLPALDFNGFTTITYRIDDGQAYSDAVVTLSVAPVPDAPIAYSSSYATAYGVARQVNPLASSFDGDGDALTVTIVAQPQHGTLVNDGGGLFTYTPTPGFSGEDSLLYSVSDGGLDSGIARITLNVAARVNRPPVASDGAANAIEDTPLDTTLSGLVSDLDRDPLTYSIVTSPLHGTVQMNGTTGAYRYTPAPDFNGDDAFTYGASDGVVTAQAVLRITVAARNDLPVMQGEVAATPAGTAIEVDVLANDRDPEGGALSLLIVQAPQGGNAVVTTGNTILFTPAPGFEGNTSLVYRATDPDGGFANASLLIQVIPPPNHAPVAVNQSVTIDEDGRFSGDLNAFVSDADGDALGLRLTALPLHGLVAFERETGLFTYTPEADFYGSDSFSFAAKDPEGAEGGATVSLTINPVNDVPDARADQARISEDAIASGNVLDNDRDVDGDALTVRLASGTQASNGLGVLDFSSDGQWQFRPNQDANGTVIFTYLVSDGLVESPATLTIVVQAVNDRPVALADFATADEDTALDGNVLGNDRDVDSPMLTTTLLVGSASVLGELSLATDGAWHFEPLANARGTVNYLYRVSDGDLVADASLSIILLPVNDAPVAGDDRAITAAGTPVELTLAGLLANDQDVDGDALAITLLSNVLGGTARFDGGRVIFSPDAGFSGAGGFDYELSDGSLGDNGHVRVFVSPPPPPGGTASLRFGNQSIETPTGSMPVPPYALQTEIDQFVAVTAAGDGGEDVRQTGAWGSIRNAEVGFTGGAAVGSWHIRNFVSVFADFGGDARAQAAGIDFNAVGIRSGVVSFGDGADTATLAAHSDAAGGAAWTELTVLDLRGGDDLVRLFTTASSSLDEAMLNGADNGAAWNADYDGRSSSYRVALGEGFDTLLTNLADRIRIDVDGGAGNDLITTGAGDDTLRGGTGDDSMTGGAGNDTYVVDSVGDVVMEAADGGLDTVYVVADFTSWSFGENVEVVRLLGPARLFNGSASGEQIVANQNLASEITGGGGDDVLWGNSLTNRLSGGEGDDIVRSQGGGGTFIGGNGDDQYVLASIDTVIIETSGPATGTDTAWVGVDGYAAQDNVEFLRLFGSATQLRGGATGSQIVANQAAASDIAGGMGDDVLWGSGFADVMRGGDGNDVFRGLGGADSMSGGRGGDIYVVIDAGTSIIENADEGDDLAWVGLPAATGFTLAANVERGILFGGADRLTGNALANVLVGEAAGSVLNGDGGDDVLFGGSGGDVFIGGAGSDVIYGGGGADHFAYAGAGWGVDLISVFSVADGAKLDFRGSGIDFGQLAINAAGGNTQVTLGSDVILVFNATLTQNDLLFG